MSLKNKISLVNGKYLTSRFRRTIEDHIPIFKNNVSTVTVDGGTSLKYRNNYLGLLNHFNIRPRYHYVVMRLNGICNPKLVEDVTVIYLPNFSEVDNLVSTLDLKEKELF